MDKTTYQVTVPVLMIRRGPHSINAFQGKLIDLTEAEAAEAEGMIREPSDEPIIAGGGGADSPFSTRVRDETGAVAAPDLPEEENDSEGREDVRAVNDDSSSGDGISQTELTEMERKLDDALAEEQGEGDDSAEDEEDEETLDPETASVKELAEWIKEDRPAIDVVVEAADGDATIAAKLIKAARTAKDSRRTLYRRLGEIGE